MKSIILLPVGIMPFFLSENVFARSIRGSMDKLGNETVKIAFAVSVVALAIGSIYLMIGKQDAGSKLTGTILGILTLVLSPAIIDLAKSVA